MKTKTHYTQVTPEYISHQFSQVIDKTGLFEQVPKPQRSTFYEIRSLGIVLYENQGLDAQTLVGHTNWMMTEYYSIHSKIPPGFDLENGLLRKGLQ